jgi:cell volume regulation protein A
VSAVALFLITVASIFLIGALGEVVFRRTQIPDVIWLLLAGIVIGPVTGLVTPDDLREIAPYFGALTLVVVLFDGGSQLDLKQIAGSAPRSSLLAVSTFLVTVVVVAGASMGARWLGWFPTEWSWVHAAMLGCILGGSSSIIIMPAMQLAKVSDDTASLVNLESAFTDAFCVVGATALIQILLAGVEAASPGVALARSFGLGASLGTAAGFAWLLVLRALHSSEHAYPVTLSALLLLYVGIDAAGGSAALGILTFAIVVGSAEHFRGILRLEADFRLSDDVRGFHRQVTFIVKSFFFTFIGAMIAPPWTLVAIGAGFGVLLLVARVPAVRLALMGGAYDAPAISLVQIAMPRGLAAGVLASMPMAAGVPGTDHLPVLVFAAVTTSIVIFTVGLPLVKKPDAAPTPS